MKKPKFILGSPVYNPSVTYFRVCVYPNENEVILAAQRFNLSGSPYALYYGVGAVLKCLQVKLVDDVRRRMAGAQVVGHQPTAFNAPNEKDKAKSKEFLDSQRDNTAEASDNDYRA